MKSVIEIVLQYRRMEEIKPDSGVLREVRWQYADMAEGSDGGPLGFTPKGWDHEPTCREYNYPGYPDSFFQEVRNLLVWK